MEEQAMLSGPLRMAKGDGVQSGKGGTRRVLAVTQRELALVIVVSRETTNQILKELEAQGILRVQRGGWRYWTYQSSGRCRDKTTVRLRP